jgi:hypothetical protein
VTGTVMLDLFTTAIREEARNDMVTKRKEN